MTFPKFIVSSQSRFMNFSALSSISRFGCVAILSLTLGACANKNKTGGQYAGVDGDYVSGTPLPERQEGVSFVGSNVDKTQFQPIYFGYDSSEVSSSESGKLASVGQFLKSGRSTVILAGFTDERGTEEYNRGLGERRAQAVRNWLISNGANGGSIQTVSFGEEMPAASGSDESAYSQNRRAEIGVVK